jgi:hypothetical protein
VSRTRLLQATARSRLCSILGAQDAQCLSSGVIARPRLSLKSNMHIRATAKLALLILGLGIVTAQTAFEDGISAITRDKRSNTNQVVSAKTPKIHVGTWFVRLPREEIVNFRKAFSADGKNSERWQTTMSELDAKRQIERWKALPGATIVDGLNFLTVADFSVELTKRLPEKPEAALRSIPFLNVLPRIDTNDSRRVHLEFTAGITNRSSALPPVERFSGVVTLWDGQRFVLPAETEGKAEESSSSSKLILVLWPEIVHDNGNLVQERK